MDETGNEPLEELLLAEDDGRLGADPRADVSRAIDGLAEPDEGDEEERPPEEDRSRERDRAE